MPSFDISSSVELQTLDNAVNLVKKEILNRFDFKGVHAIIDLNKKDLIVNLEVDDEMKMSQMEDMLITKSMRQGLDAKCFDLSKIYSHSGKYLKKEIPVRNGIDKEKAKEIVKFIKENNNKVQVAIMDDIVRVSGKKLDDLQSVIQKCKINDFGIPLQFGNMRS